MTNATPDTTQRGTCDTCGRERRVYVLGTTVDLRFPEDVPVLRCGSCIHRQARRTNTRSMWGRGRRGY